MFQKISNKWWFFDTNGKLYYQFTTRTTVTEVFFLVKLSFQFPDKIEDKTLLHY